MFRAFAPLCVAVVFAFSTAVAQDIPDNVIINATPEILSLFDESLQALLQVESNQRVGMLFQTLGFAISFDDKAPAQKIINAILELAPAIESADLRNQVYEGIANALCDLEKYTEAAAVLGRIADAADRCKSQLNIAARIVIGHEQDKTLQPFDATALLQQAVGGAAVSKDIITEALARTFLAQELARQGKQTESVSAFTEAMKATQKVEDAEEREDIVGMILRHQVEYDQISGAATMLRAIAPEKREMPTVAMTDALIRREKYNEAETLIKTLQPGGMKDNLIGDYLMSTLKTLTDAKVGELTTLVSSDDVRERFLQVVTGQLQKNGRGDVAVQVSKRLKEPTVAEMALFIGKIEALVEEKKFAEAIRFIDESEENDAIRQHLKRQLLMMQYHETYDESVAGQIEATFTNSEKVTVAGLREESKQAVVEVADLTERIDILFEIFQEQSRFLDFAGAKQTLKAVAEQLDKGTDQVQIISDRLLLARLQVELRDKEGAKSNLGKLLQTLSAVKDLKELKNLVPAQLPVAGVEPTVDESAIQSQLFQFYLMSASLLSIVDASAESQAAFAKAKELAKLESIAVIKAEKLLILAQLLAEDLK